MPFPTTPTSVPVSQPATIQADHLWYEQFVLNQKSLDQKPGAASIVIRPFRAGAPNVFADESARIHWTTSNLGAALANLVATGRTKAAQVFADFDLMGPELLAYQQDRAADAATAQTRLATAQAANDAAQATLTSARAAVAAASTALFAATIANQTAQAAAALPNATDADKAAATQAAATLATAQGNLAAAQAALQTAQAATVAPAAALATAKANLATATAAWQDPGNPRWTP